MADGIDHHQRALPTIGAITAPDPAVFEVPMGQLLFEPLLDLAIAIGTLGRCHRYQKPLNFQPKTMVFQASPYFLPLRVWLPLFYPDPRPIAIGELNASYSRYLRDSTRN